MNAILDITYENTKGNIKVFSFSQLTLYKIKDNFFFRYFISKIKKSPIILSKFPDFSLAL